MEETLMKKNVNVIAKVGHQKLEEIISFKYLLCFLNLASFFLKI